MANEISKFPLIAPDADPTAQEVFDAAARWLLAQAEPCMTEGVYDDDGECFTGEYCCYRSVDGQNACAVGAFMTDEFARLVDKRGELAVSDVIMDFGDLAPRWFEKHASLLSGLQGVHDGYSKPRETALAELAKAQGLHFHKA